MTLLRYGRIKFVTTANPIDSVRSPSQTRTPGRIYVTVSKGKLKCITFYRPDGRKRIQIDLDHWHNGEMPHKHIGYNHGLDGRMTNANKKLVERIVAKWKEYKSNEKT